MGLDALALGNEHVAEEHDDVERDSKISSDEVLVVKLAGGGVDEDVEVLGQGDEDREEQDDDGTPVALRGDIGHGAVGNVLGATSTEEEEVGDEDGDPSQDTEDGDEVDKVAKDHGTGGGSIHKRQAGNSCAKEKRWVGNTTLVCSLEDGGSSVIGGKAVESSAGNVQVGVGGRKDKDQNTGVDDVRQDLDAGEGGGDDEGRSVGTGALLVGKGELGAVVRDNHADKEDAEAVEEEDTEEGELDGCGYSS